MAIRESAQDKFKFTATVTGTGIVGDNIRHTVKAENTVRIITEGSTPATIVTVSGTIANEAPILIASIVNDDNVVLDVSTFDYIIIETTVYGGTPFQLFASGFFTKTADAAGTPGGISGPPRRAWFFQDFPAGTGPAITITSNANGTGGAPFSTAKIISSSAVITNTLNTRTYTGSIPLFSSAVKVSAHAGASVTLTGVPDVSFGGIRVYYLYEANIFDLPNKMQYAPDIVTKERLDQWHATYLDAEENLADLTNVPVARDNLGLSFTGTFIVGDWVANGDTFRLSINHALGTLHPFIHVFESDFEVFMHDFEVIDLDNINIFVTREEVDARFAGKFMIGCLTGVSL